MGLVSAATASRERTWTGQGDQDQDGLMLFLSLAFMEGLLVHSEDEGPIMMNLGHRILEGQERKYNLKPR